MTESGTPIVRRIWATLASIIKNVVLDCLSMMPTRLLELGESISQWGLGKGSGSGSNLEEVRACLGSLNLDKSEELIALDVGANKGDWTSELLRQRENSRIWLFEPSSEAFKKINERFAADSRVSKVNVALGKTEGEETLWANIPGSGLASLTKRQLDYWGLPFEYSEKVKVIRLSNWLANTGIKPHILKLDIEGHELDVLYEAREVIRDIPVVQFEFGSCNIDTRTYFRDFFNYFTELNFTVKRIGRTRLLSVGNYRLRDEVFTTTNYLAIRN